uniref:Cytoskeleton-associated protein 5 n=1 Tax=Heterorhabditis bacteriophora TaxID=37862 RepID=A0A1I7XQC1_HETBA
MHIHCSNRSLVDIIPTILAANISVTMKDEEQDDFFENETLTKQKHRLHKDTDLLNYKTPDAIFCEKNNKSEFMIPVAVTLIHQKSGELEKTYIDEITKYIFKLINLVLTQFHESERSDIELKITVEKESNNLPSVVFDLIRKRRPHGENSMFCVNRKGYGVKSDFEEKKLQHFQAMDDWDFVDEVDVLTKLPSNFNELRESKKWQERKEALEILCGLLDSNSRLSTKASYGEILGNLQTMLAKDVNINVTALAAKCIKGFATGLRTKFSSYAQSVSSLIVRVIIEKLKEKKMVLVDPLVECIDAIASTIPSIEVLQEEIITGLGKPNPQIKQQVDNFLFRQLNLLTVEKVNLKFKFLIMVVICSLFLAPKKLIKAAVPLLVKHSGDADQDVRDASLEAIGAIYRLIGDKNTRSMLGDLVNDESKMKRIVEFAEKSASAHAEDQAKLSCRNEASQFVAVHLTDESEANTCSPTPSVPVLKDIDPWDFMDPVDVLSKLPSDFDISLDSKKWTERRDALQSYYDLLIANPKLDPKVSYGENIALLKKVIEKDANINVAALAAKCLKSLAEGLRKKFAPHAATVIPIILEKFKEKKPLLRDPLVECIDAVASSITLEAMNDDLLVALEKPNPNIKIQTDLFLYREFKRLNAATMPKKTLKAITPLLIKHTGDSDPEVRDASYAALGSAMRAIGEKACLPLLADIAEDKLKMSKIKEFYNKACEEAGPEIVAQMVQSIHKADMKAASQSRSQSKEPVSRIAKQPAEEEEEEALKPSSGVSSAKKVERKEYPKKLLSTNEDKQQRVKEERSLKVSNFLKSCLVIWSFKICLRFQCSWHTLYYFQVLKWNFSTPTEEHVCQLQESLGKYAKASLMGMLFHKDFKQHLKAIEILNKMGEANPNVLVSNSDLLLKWCTLRFFETNPAVLIKALELAKQILAFSRSAEEPMSTEEMNAFVPYLFLKSGEQKENMRIAVREIVEELSDICGPFKMCPFLIDALRTKNARQRAECLQVLEAYISRVGLTQLKTLGVHKAIAACVSDRDVNVRNAAINGLVACYREEGDMVIFTSIFL